MTTRPHFDDLRRRYRETDWVSELQRLWAIFNHWFTAEFPGATDRDQIEAFKADARLSTFVENVIQGTPYYLSPHRVTDGYGGTYPRFATNNVISRFFRGIVASPMLEPGVNLPWRASSSARPPRLTNTIILSSEAFREVYFHHAALLSTPEYMVVDATLHQTFPAIGVRSTGCCFWRVVPVAVPEAPTAFAQDFISRCSTIPSFFNLASSTAPLTSIEADMVETLYQARNAAMHGSLDFLVPGDNAAARVSCDLLDALIQDIRSNW
jgi:hypothetical protein